MKVRHLFETLDFLKFLPEPKLKKVKSFLTPEVAANHHELICQVLAKFVPGKDLDVLAAAVAGGTESQESVDFSLKMMVKALTPSVPNVQVKQPNWENGEKVAFVSGSHTDKVKVYKLPMNYTFNFRIRHSKAKWEVSHSKVGSLDNWTTKRVSTAGEALAYIKQQLTKFEKFKLETEAHNKKRESEEAST